MKTVSINGKNISCYTLQEFANECGKSRSALIKMESKGVLPYPNVKIPFDSNMGPTFVRLYTRELVAEVAPIISSFRPFVSITNEQITEIQHAFRRELNRLKDA